MKNLSEKKSPFGAYLLEAAAVSKTSRQIFLFLKFEPLRWSALGRWEAAELQEYKKSSAGQMSFEQITQNARIAGQKGKQTRLWDSKLGGDNLVRSPQETFEEPSDSKHNP